MSTNSISAKFGQLPMQQKIALNWEICSAYRMFQVNTEIVGMKSLLHCSQMAKVAAKSKLFALFPWIGSAKEAEEHEAHTAAFREFVPSNIIQLTPVMLADLFAESEEIEIPRECRLV